MQVSQMGCREIPEIGTLLVQRKQVTNVWYCGGGGWLVESVGVGSVAGVARVKASVSQTRAVVVLQPWSAAWR